MPEETTVLPPLHAASSDLDIEEVKRLIAAGANATAVDCYKQTALHYMFTTSSMFKTRYVELYEAFGDLFGDLTPETINAQCKNGNTLLSLAVRHNTPELVEILLNTAGIDKTALNSQGNNLLHISALYNKKDYRVFDLVLPHYDINATNHEGSSALHLAVRSSNLDAIQRLIRSGAEIDIVDSSNHTPLYSTVRSRSRHKSQIIKMLKDADANPALARADSAKDYQLILRASSEDIGSVSEFSPVSSSDTTQPFSSTRSSYSDAMIASPMIQSMICPPFSSPSNSTEEITPDATVRRDSIDSDGILEDRLEDLEINK